MNSDELVGKTQQLSKGIDDNLQLLSDALANSEILLRLRSGEQTIVNGPSIICSVIGWKTVIDKLAADARAHQKVVQELGMLLLNGQLAHGTVKGNLRWQQRYNEIFDDLVTKEWRKARGRRPLKEIRAEADMLAKSLPPPVSKVSPLDDSIEGMVQS